MMRVFRREAVDRPPDDAAEKHDARTRADRAIETTLQLQAELDAMTQHSPRDRRR